MTSLIILAFQSVKVSNQNTLLRNDLKEALIYRIKERRIFYSDIYQHIFDSNLQNWENDDYGYFNKTSETAIKNKIVEISKTYTHTYIIKTILIVQMNQK